MQKIIAFLIIVSVVSLTTPVHAGLTTDFDPVEKQLIEKQQHEKLQLERQQQEKEQLERQQLMEKQRAEENLNKGFMQQSAESTKTEPQVKKSGSSWWKWVLGVAVIGGAAAAAGGGGGGGSKTSSPSGGSVSASW